MKYPIIYKQIPVQFAFMIHEDGRLQAIMLNPILQEKKFENGKEARKYVENLDEIL
jgi:hypothetical protein